MGGQARYLATLVSSVVFEPMPKKMKTDGNREAMKTDANEKAMKGDAQEEAKPAAAQDLPATVALSAEQIEGLKERAAKADETWDRKRAAKADETWDRFLRQAADFENYKKRAARERQEAVTFANESLLQKLIPTLDAFEMALAAAKPDPATQSLRAGIVMVSNQLKSTLAEAGLEEIDAAGKMFDPAIHQAVSQQETAEVPEGCVVQQIRKGYKFHNRLIRPAGVIVAQKPAA
jgi:molecular chaperone GrpE